MLLRAAGLLELLLFCFAFPSIFFLYFLPFVLDFLAWSSVFSIPEGIFASYYQLYPCDLIPNWLGITNMRPFIFSAVLLATSLAAPTNLNGVYDFSNDLADFYSKVSHHINDAKDSAGSFASCDKSKIALPAHASGLPRPNGQKPLYVAVGRGTQVGNIPFKEDPNLTAPRTTLVRHRPPTLLPKLSAQLRPSTT